VALGATVAIALTDNGAIQFAHLVDPVGNRIGIWRPNAQWPSPGRGRARYLSR
jgi:predicted enzyme related to lactoylglutathione lyase